jgi:ribose/xylose/arabinose/galactoside ABC-type transport system permease subunit
MLALLLVFFIRTGLGVANVTAEYQLAAVGSLLVLAVMLGNFSEKLVGFRQSRNRTGNT